MEIPVGIFLKNLNLFQIYMYIQKSKIAKSA